MSRFWSFALTGLGGFLVVVGIGSRAYMYPHLAVIPVDTDTDVVATTSPGADAEYFDVASLSVRTAPLQSTSYIRGDSSASASASKELGRDVAVWSIYGCTDKPGADCASNPLPLSGAIDYFAMDRSSGELVDWDGSYRQTDTKDTSVPFEGLVVKFPFDTEKKTYQFWDGTLREPTDVSFTGTSKVAGLAVYTFEQTIAPAKVGEIDVPGSLVGSDDPTVTGDRMYSVRRTFAVEPTTGVVIDRDEDLDSYLAVDGQRAITLTKASLGYDESTVASTAKDYKTLSFLLRQIHTTVPLVGTPTGILCVVAGAVLASRRRRRPNATATSSAEQQRVKASV